MYILSNNSTGDIPQDLSSIRYFVPGQFEPQGTNAVIEVISQIEKARKKLGGHANKMTGVTMLFNTDWNGMQRVGRFIEEAFFGSWKSEESLWPPSYISIFL